MQQPECPSIHSASGKVVTTFYTSLRKRISFNVVPFRWFEFVLMLYENSLVVRLKVQALVKVLSLLTKYS